MNCRGFGAGILIGHVIFLKKPLPVTLPMHMRGSIWQNGILKEQQISLAKRELQKVIQIPPRHRLYSWVHSYKPEATRLFKEIEETPEGHGR